MKKEEKRNPGKISISKDAVAGAISGLVASSSLHALDTRIIKNQVKDVPSFKLKLLKGTLTPAIGYPAYFVARNALEKIHNQFEKKASLGIVSTILRGAKMLGNSAPGNFAKGLTGLGGGAGIKDMFMRPLQNKAFIGGTVGSMALSSKASTFSKPTTLEQTFKF